MNHYCQKEKRPNNQSASQLRPINVGQKANAFFSSGFEGAFKMIFFFFFNLRYHIKSCFKNKVHISRLVH